MKLTFPKIFVGQCYISREHCSRRLHES